MTDRTDAVVQALFNQPSLQQCTLEQVEELAQQYPYFTVAQLLLAQKTSNTPAHDGLLHRSALQASNPLQVLQWLQPDVFETAMPAPQLFQNLISDAPVEIEPQPEDTNVLPPVAEPATETISIEEPALPTPEAEPATETIFVEESVLPTPQAETNEPLQQQQAPPAVPTLSFEPYHTVDYFASQGIKLSQQEVSSDALGKQLKSFTEWLKTMKRLPVAAAPPQPDKGVERNVENLAAHSLDTAEIVTESMAEVWLKQGNKEKAADVYTKLSLRHPAKTAYFAAKIEALKKL